MTMIEETVTPEEEQYLLRIHPDARQQWLAFYRNPKTRTPAIFVATASREALQKILGAIEAELARREAVNDARL